MKLSIKVTIILFFGIIIFFTSCKKFFNEPPSKPRIVSPENNSVLDKIPTKLAWSCIDKDNDNLTFDLYFGTDNPPELLASEINSSEYSDFEVLSEQTYYWKVIAKDDYGEVTEGDIWTFTTGNFPPETPSNPFPENNSIDQNPTLISWECTEPDGETLTYDIYFGTASDDLELLEQNYTENNYELTELTGNKKYYWRIIAKDSYGNEITGPLWNFTTDFFAAELIFPEENSDTAPWFPKFKWTGNNTEDLTYDLYLGTSSNPGLLASDLTDTSYHYLEQLIKEQTYYWKVVSKKTDGSTAESPVWSFTVFGDPQFSSFTDARDGNTYQTVTIGNQIWMAENLKYNAEGSRVYDDDPLNKDIYGRLYNWEQVMNGEEGSNEVPSGVQGIAPEGWHIPSQKEWEILIDFLGGYDNAGNFLKEMGTILWLSPNGGTNESGFNALPGGNYDFSACGCYYFLNEWGTFWTSRSYVYGYLRIKVILLKYDHSDAILYYFTSPQFASLRCLKN